MVKECEALGLEVVEIPTAVENETDMQKALEEAKQAGCNALTVFLGNFGPETPETLLPNTLTALYVCGGGGRGRRPYRRPGGRLLRACSTAPITWACGA